MTRWNGGRFFTIFLDKRDKTKTDEGLRTIAGDQTKLAFSVRDLRANLKIHWKARDRIERPEKSSYPTYQVRKGLPKIPSSVVTNVEQKFTHKLAFA